jgi:hypothetical protein
MNKEQLFKSSGLSGTFDSALPQILFDKLSEVLRFCSHDEVSINPLELFVWWYPDREDKAYSLGGRLLPISRLYALAEEQREYPE